MNNQWKDEGRCGACGAEPRYGWIINTSDEALAGMPVCRQCYENHDVIQPLPPRNAAHDGDSVDVCGHCLRKTESAGWLIWFRDGGGRVPLCKTCFASALQGNARMDAR